MAISHSTGARNAMADAVAARLNNGKIKLYTSDDTLLATLTFASTAFGSASGGVITANAITGDSAADATGTAAKATFTDASDGVEISGLTVTASGGGGNIILATTSISQNVAVNLSTATWTAPA